MNPKIKAIYRHVLIKGGKIRVIDCGYNSYAVEFLNPNRTFNFFTLDIHPKEGRDPRARRMTYIPGLTNE